MSARPAPTRTVREIGGEIWAELMAEMRDSANSDNDIYHGFSVEAVSATIDLITGVLARYAGTTIVNDDDLPVTPLPKRP